MTAQTPQLQNPDGMGHVMGRGMPPPPTHTHTSWLVEEDSAFPSPLPSNRAWLSPLLLLASSSWTGPRA